MKASLSGVSVVVGQADESTLVDLCKIAESLELKVIGRTTLASDLAKEGKLNKPDLIISAVHYSDGSGIEALLEIAEEESVPAVIIAQKDNLADVEKATEDHVMGFLIDPVDPQDLRTTCYLVLRRFEEFKELRKENAELKDALVTRKKLERAKGIVMEKYQLSEEDAYLRIRKVATTRRMKISEVADIVIEDALSADSEE